MDMITGGCCFLWKLQGARLTSYTAWGDGKCCEEASITRRVGLSLRFGRGKMSMNVLGWFSIGAASFWAQMGRTATRTAIDVMIHLCRPLLLPERLCRTLFGVRREFLYFPLRATNSHALSEGFTGGSYLNKNLLHVFLKFLHFKNVKAQVHSCR